MQKNHQKLVSRYQALLPTFKLELQLKNSNNTHQLCIVAINRESGVIYDAQLNDMKINIQSVGFFDNTQSAFDFISKNIQQKQLNDKRIKSGTQIKFSQNKNKGKGLFVNSSNLKDSQILSDNAQNSDVISLTEDGNLILNIPNQLDPTGKGSPISHRLQMTFQTKQREMSEVEKIISQNSLLREELTFTQKQNSNTRKVLSQQNQNLKRLSSNLKFSTDNVEKLKRQIQQQNRQNDDLLKQIEEIQLENEQSDTTVLKLQIQFQSKKRQLQRLKTGTHNSSSQDNSSDLDQSSEQSELQEKNQQRQQQRNGRKQKQKFKINQDDFTPTVNRQSPLDNNTNIDKKDINFPNLMPVIEQSKSYNDSYSKSKTHNIEEGQQNEQEILSVHSSDSQFTRDIKQLHISKKTEMMNTQKELRNSQSCKEIPKNKTKSSTNDKYFQEKKISQIDTPTFIDYVPQSFSQNIQKLQNKQKVDSALKKRDSKMKSTKQSNKTDEQKIKPMKGLNSVSDKKIDYKSSQVIQKNVFQAVCTKNFQQNQDKDQKNYISLYQKNISLENDQEKWKLDKQNQRQKKLEILNEQIANAPKQSIHIKPKKLNIINKTQRYESQLSDSDSDKGRMALSSVRIKRQLSQIINEKISQLSEQQLGNYKRNRKIRKQQISQSQEQSVVLQGKFDEPSGFRNWLQYSDPFEQLKQVKKNTETQKQKQKNKQKVSNKQFESRVTKFSKSVANRNSFQFKRERKQIKQIGFLNKKNELDYKKQGISFKFDNNILTKTGRAKYQQIVGSNMIPVNSFNSQDQGKQICFFRVKVLNSFNYQILFGLVTQAGSRFHSSCISKQSIYYSCWDGCIWSQGKRISHNKPLGQLIDRQDGKNKIIDQQHLGVELKMQIARTSNSEQNQKCLLYSLTWFVNNQRVGKYDISSEFMSKKCYPKVQLSYLGDSVFIF